jgi:indole-3-glycerol phosphate synthase
MGAGINQSVMLIRSKLTIYIYSSTRLLLVTSTYSWTDFPNMNNAGTSSGHGLGLRTLQRLLYAIFLFTRLSFSASFQSPPHTTTTRIKCTALESSRTPPEDLFSAVHRKEYEMKSVKSQHTSTTDPVVMAMSYYQESASPMRLAKALRRVYENPDSPNHPNNNGAKEKTVDDQKRQEKLSEVGMGEIGMRRASFIVDIKRKSLSSPNEVFCNFDDAGMVAEAMVQLGADVVIINTDYRAYGGDMAELKAAVRAVRRISKTVPVVMKDIVVDEIQLGLAKEAGADGIVLIAAVLGPALDTFLDLATTIGLETIVECHTRNEVQRALDAMACTILINNFDRVSQTLYPKQAIQLAGMFPGSGGPIVCLAGGGIQNTDQMKKHLAVGYDGVVVGKAVMGNPSAPEFIRAVRDRTLLPAELSQWGLDDMEFDMDGYPMPGPKKGIPTEKDKEAYQ